MRTRLLLIAGLAMAGLALAVADPRPAPDRAPSPEAVIAEMPAWEVTGQLWDEGDRPAVLPAPLASAAPAAGASDSPALNVWATPATFSDSD